MLLVLPFFVVQGCGLRERRQTYRAEREALADTVAKIHSAQLRILTLEVPPELISPRVIEVFERSGSIQELHEQSEYTLEIHEENVRSTEEDIARYKLEIEARRGKPNPYTDLNEARSRIQELYFELLRVRNLRWRRE